MKFMVKAREAQRARAREDAEKLLEELEADRSGSDDDDDEDGAALRELAALSGDAPAGTGSASNYSVAGQLAQGAPEARRGGRGRAGGG